MTERGRRRIDWGTFWGAIAFLVVGGGFAVFGAYQVVTTYAFMGDAVVRPAEVVETSESCDDDGCTWWPTVRYTSPDGQEQVKRTRFGASNYGWAEGAEIGVLHNDAYSYVRIPGPDNLYLMGGAFFLIGMVPVILSFYLMATQVVVHAVNKDA